SPAGNMHKTLALLEYRIGFIESHPQGSVVAAKRTTPSTPGALCRRTGRAAACSADLSRKDGALPERRRRVRPHTSIIEMLLEKEQEHNRTANARYTYRRELLTPIARDSKAALGPSRLDVRYAPLGAPVATHTLCSRRLRPTCGAAPRPRHFGHRRDRPRRPPVDGPPPPVLGHLRRGGHRQVALRPRPQAAHPRRHRALRA